MSESTATLPTNDTQKEESESKPGFFKRLFLGTSAQGFIARMTLIPVFIYLLIFIFGFAWAWFSPQGSANFFDTMRDLLEIALALAAIIIFIAIGILVIQMARFINLLRSEIKPITEDTKDAVKNIRVTAEFVQKHGIEPIIRIQSFLFALTTFLIELVRVSRLLQQRERSSSTNEGIDSESGEAEENE